MDIKQFLDLPLDQREVLVSLHEKQKYINRQWEKIKEDEKSLGIRKLNLQLECEHPFASRVPKADTGNWCPTDDKYWYDCKCPDCGKVWQEDQS